ncbi:hypothetical protein Riv7116_1877 [Rivularia sp. PCC 7116]|uniref:hypothetical protein n=1 Tax=Rivularia sp. PCC 7116 TaxID=373994 RepID=UPI00029F293A|nr:hypothetical protein [Rivularia sp. PCC 7116]AFY54418.1 hypothetical protein Riv7116_1877 [Rivularia sp. PCC 7116]
MESSELNYINQSDDQLINFDDSLIDNSSIDDIELDSSLKSILEVGNIVIGNGQWIVDDETTQESLTAEVKADVDGRIDSLFNKLRDRLPLNETEEESAGNPFTEENPFANGENPFGEEEFTPPPGYNNSPLPSPDIVDEVEFVENSNPTEETENPVVEDSNPTEETENPVVEDFNPTEETKTDNLVVEDSKPIEDTEADNSVVENSNPTEETETDNSVVEDSNSTEETKTDNLVVEDSNPTEETETDNSVVEDSNSTVENENPFSGGEGGNPFAGGEGDGNPFAGGEGGNPFAGGEGGENPFSGGEGENPFAGGEGENPFAGGEGENPFAGAEGENPFSGGEGGENPFAGGEGGENPFAGGEGENPFAGGEGGGNPSQSFDMLGMIAGEDLSFLNASEGDANYSAIPNQSTSETLKLVRESLLKFNANLNSPEFFAGNETPLQTPNGLLTLFRNDMFSFNNTANSFQELVGDENPFSSGEYNPFGEGTLAEEIPFDILNVALDGLLPFNGSENVFSTPEGEIPIGNGNQDFGSENAVIGNANWNYGNLNATIGNGNWNWDGTSNNSTVGNGNWHLDFSVDNNTVGNGNWYWDSSSQNTTLGNGNWYFGDNNTTIGNGNWDFGNNNTVIGNGNRVYTDNSIVIGNGNWSVVVDKSAEIADDLLGELETIAMGVGVKQSANMLVDSLMNKVGEIFQPLTEDFDDSALNTYNEQFVDSGFDISLLAT